MMTYDEAIAFWYGRVNFERKAPQPGDLKLDRMRELLRLVGDPHEKLRTIHVAGSKGKGSTCAMLASICRCAGFRTGLFTSPHLTDVRERIQIDGEPISRDQLAALMAEIKPAVDDLESAGEPPTFFEVGTALGFLHFVRQACDLAIIEVGLGGRFDSTNVLTPLVSVISSISLDHTQMLGETVEQIAFEKAGIIKPRVPVVSGVTEAGPRAVIRRIAAERGASLVQLGVDIELIVSHNRDAIVRWSDHDIRIKPRLMGRHQLVNAALAVAVIEQLRIQGFSFSDQVIKNGLSRVQWPARFEIFHTIPTAVLDCAHNVASAKALVETLNQHVRHFSDWRLIFAVSADKDVAGMFQAFASHFRRYYLTRFLQSARAVMPERLADHLPAATTRFICANPAVAWRAASSDATAETLVVIAGSVFLAGEIRPMLVEACRPFSDAK